ncbi:helix-turn-helix transcriptional regulator [Rhodoferax sp. WC2427]|uniref:helix-turn-helix transcriptional regulator n=1 Tax=Rhodoferax sp. WC2427 TaxID=3234144 RepID=UPI00346596C5
MSIAINIRPAALEPPDAATYVALSVTTVERLVREGKFPKPRQLSGRRVGYLVRELDSWLDDCPVSDLLPPPNTSRRAAKGSMPGLQDAQPGV